MPFDFSKLIFATFLGFIFFNEQIDSITIICGIGIVFCNSMLFKRLNFEKKIDFTINYTVAFFFYSRFAN